MKAKNTSNFRKVTEWMRRLKLRYMYALAAHRTFSELNRALTVTFVGKNVANKNVDVIKKYNYFFNPSKEGLRYFLIIELSKFFEVDSREDSLTLHHLLNYTEKNLRYFSKDYFKEHHSDKKFLEKDIEQLQEISVSDIKMFKNRIKKNQRRIDNLKNYRDEYIAHDDIKQKIYTINNRDVSVLLRLVKDIINYYYTRLEWASVIYDNFDREPVNHTKKIFADLRKFDSQEKADLKRKWHL